MQRGVARLEYGNADSRGAIDRFWLDGPLRISAVEQIEFLVRLFRNSLPVRDRSRRIVKEIMLTEASPDYILRSKTGYAASTPLGIGWWVGWVEREENVYFFALNLDIARSEQLAYRAAIARAILRDEAILPAP